MQQVKPIRKKYPENLEENERKTMAEIDETIDTHGGWPINIEAKIRR